MKRSIITWLSVVMFVSLCSYAQQLQPGGVFLSSNGTPAGPWNPYMLAASGAPSLFTPDGIALYYSSTNTPAGPWYPCTLAICFQGGGPAGPWLPLAGGTMTGPASLYTGTTAPTTAYAGDATTKVATDQFVQNAINYSMATVPMTLSTGTYSFDAASTCAPTIGFTASGNISAIGTIYSGGTGCVVGDLLSVGGGNRDAILQVATLTGSATASLNIVYGGTGYTSAINIATGVASSVPFTFLLSGSLSGNVTLVMTRGTYLTQSNQWIFADNTTGYPTYAVTVCVAGATDACAAGGRTVTLVEGTNNSTSTILQTDGVLNVDLAVGYTKLQVVTTAAEYSNGTCTNSSTIDYHNGPWQSITLTNGDTCALTFTQPSSATASVALRIIQSAVSTYNGAISGCLWPGGTVPTITATTGAVDFISAYMNGSTTYCVANQNFK